MPDTVHLARNVIVTFVAFALEPFPFALAYGNDSNPWSCEHLHPTR